MTDSAPSLMDASTTPPLRVRRLLAFFGISLVFFNYQNQKVPNDPAVAVLVGASLGIVGIAILNALSKLSKRGRVPRLTFRAIAGLLGLVLLVTVVTQVVAQLPLVVWWPICGALGGVASAWLRRPRSCWMNAPNALVLTFDTVVGSFAGTAVTAAVAGLAGRSFGMLAVSSIVIAVYLLWIVSLLAFAVRGDIGSPPTEPTA